MTHHFRICPLMMVGLLLTAACTAIGESGEALQRDEVVVHVQNRHWSQATVYVENGLRRRVGTVSGNSEAYLDASLPIGGRLSFEIRLLAGGTHRTEGIAGMPGDTIVVEIPSTLR